MLDPVVLAVLVIVVTSVILGFYLLGSGGKPTPSHKKISNKTSADTNQPSGPIPVVSNKDLNNEVSDALDCNVEVTDSNEHVEVSEVRGQPTHIDECLEQEVAAFAEELAAIEDPNEEMALASESETHMDAELAREIIFELEEPLPEAAAELEQNHISEDLPEQTEAEQEQDESEGFRDSFRDSQYEQVDPEDIDIGPYDESEYNVDDNNELPLDASSPPRSPVKRSNSSSMNRSASPLPSGGNGGLSPMNKFGSHYQHKKVGASWVKDANSQASLAAASPVTLSPVRYSQPRKVIPTSDQEQPLSRKQSNMISQCKYTTG